MIVISELSASVNERVWRPIHAVGEPGSSHLTDRVVFHFLPTSGDPMAADFEAFYEAATLGDREALEAMLAENPGLVRASDRMGFTALHGVAGQDESELAEFLIDQGADVAAKND